MITKIQHTDGRTLQIGSVVVQKSNWADGVVRLAFGRVTRIGQNQDGGFSVEAEVFRRGLHGYGEDWGKRHCGVLSTVDGGTLRSVWISNEADSGEEAFRFQDGNRWELSVSLGRWASSEAIAFSALHGGPTGSGRSDHGWASLQ